MLDKKFYNLVWSTTSWWVSILTQLWIFFLQFILYIYYIIMKLNWFELFF